MRYASLDEVRAALAGPVASVRTPFRKDGSIDYDGLRNYVEFVVEAGSGSVVLTHGDSLFSLLSYDEVAEVTKTVVEQAGDRAMVCAATGIWPTERSVEFAHYCRECGADMLMVLPPDWGGSTTVDTLVAHYAAPTDELPVMIVTNLFLRRGDGFGLKTVEAVRDRVDGVVAVKDDVCGDFGRRLSLLVRDRWAVLVGGQKRNHLGVAHYGADGFLSFALTCKPDVAHRYWRAIEHEAFGDAAQIISEFEMPLFDYILKLPGGFDAGFHGIYELTGIFERWRRPPYYSLNDKQMEELADVCRSLSII